MIENVRTNKASRESWRIKTCPAERETIDLQILFTNAEAERLMLGHIPTEMEDKWFIFFEDGWLYFHRSWTGHCIYALRLEGSPAGIGVAESWASRNRSEYNSPGVEVERKLIAELISSKLLY